VKPPVSPTASVIWLPVPVTPVGRHGPPVVGVMSDAPQTLIREWMDLALKRAEVQL
jgi:hypothetical protein